MQDRKTSTSATGGEARAGSARLRLTRSACDAVIFDMDGVVTDTAQVHARAWKETFDEFLERRARKQGGALEPFDIVDDYKRHVDGVPRYDGVRRFLASRHIALEEGSPDDPTDRDTVFGIGKRKNERFLEVLRRDGARRFDDAVDLLDRLHRHGIRTAVISASRNAEEVLEAAGVAERFEARVDGVVQRQEGLRGKPAPDVFVEAARRVGARPERSAVIEDALAGVEAGRAGRFSWVIGVARGGDPAPLRRAGADVVVDDLSEIEVGDEDAPPVGASRRVRGAREQGPARADAPDADGRPIGELPSAEDRLGRGRLDARRPARAQGLRRGRPLPARPALGGACAARSGGAGPHVAERAAPHRRPEGVRAASRSALGQGARTRLDPRADGLASGETCPLYVGDDLTDEDAFAFVEESGIGILVRGREGTARAHTTRSPIRTRSAASSTRSIRAW